MTEYYTFFTFSINFVATHEVYTRMLRRERARELICPSETVLLSNLSKDDEQWHLFATTLKEDELPR